MYPLVSVITPSFNQAQYLEETILSVLNQDYDNIEYIIIDGESTDNSIDIIKKHENRISFWISERDCGQADAINKGFLKSKGEYICWLNSDDVLYPGFIKTRVFQFQQNPETDMIYGDVDQGADIKNTWRRKGAQTSYLLMRKSLEIPIPQQSAVWRRNVLDKTGLLDPQWHVLLDRDYFIRISRNHRIKYIPGALAFFRIHQQSKSINEATKWAEELPVYYKSLTEKWIDYKKNRSQVMAHCYWHCSKIYFENGDTGSAVQFHEKSKNESYFTFFRLQFFTYLVKVNQKIKSLI